MAISTRGIKIFSKTLDAWVDSLIQAEEVEESGGYYEIAGVRKTYFRSMEKFFKYYIQSKWAKELINRIFDAYENAVYGGGFSKPGIKDLEEKVHEAFLLNSAEPWPHEDALEDVLEVIDSVNSKYNLDSRI